MTGRRRWAGLLALAVLAAAGVAVLLVGRDSTSRSEDLARTTDADIVPPPVWADHVVGTPPSLEGRTPDPAGTRAESARVLAGTVVDASSRPIPGAEIVFAKVVGRVTSFPDLLDGCERVAVAVADAEGRFRVTRPEGPVRVVTRAAGFATDVRSWSPPGDAKPLRIALGPEQVLAGIVVDERGARVAGAMVSARAESDDWPAGLTTRVLSDSHGRFEIRGIFLGRDVVLASWRTGGAASVDVHRYGSETEEGESDLRLVLGGARPIAVRVLDEESGAPLPDVEVRAESPDSVAWTDAEGRAVVDRPFREPAQVRASREDYPVRRMPIPPPPANGTIAPELVIRLTRGAVITGRVTTSAGGPLEGVTVKLEGADWTEPVSTGSDGSFRLPARRSRVPVKLTLRRKGLPQKQTPDFVVSGPEIDLGEISLPTGAIVSVRVLDPGGKPLADGWIEWGERPRLGVRGPISVGDQEIGRFPPGELSIRAGHDRYVTGEEKVRVPEDGAPMLVTIRLREGLAVEGAVLDPEGAPLARQSVSIAEKTVETDPEGRFRIEGLAPGSHRIAVARNAELVWEPLDVEAGGRPVVFRAQRRSE